MHLNLQLPQQDSLAGFSLWAAEWNEIKWETQKFPSPSTIFSPPHPKQAIQIDYSRA